MDILQKSISIIHKGQTLRGMEHIPSEHKHPAVILLHGFTGTKLEPHRLFLKISRALEEMNVASFRFDFLGSGESDGHFEDMTVLKEVDQAEAILEYVKTHPSVDSDNIYLLGFSMGGLVASLVAGKRFNEVSKLLLLAPAGTMSQSKTLAVALENYIEEKDAYDVGGNLISKEFIDELQTINVWDTAKLFSNEVLLIHGTMDEAVPYEVSSMYIDKCYGKNAILKTIENGDHTFNSYHWEQEVISDIINFVKK
ncbi:alpha/beta hydrolase [Bacillus alkalicellulosilyticus]|uniref:alpha/beta hydrolase n=1 Tax=Alkalihalobacterium alkalicellulosilyticum TaxID=1912214 RepID=UPI001FEB0BC5|nr:alpha/beta fold hydrolase [Bacillus alkalicellulosilyticus]